MNDPHITHMTNTVTVASMRENQVQYLRQMAGGRDYDNHIVTEVSFAAISEIDRLRARVAELESKPAPQWTRTPPTEPGWYARWLECWDEEEDIPNICHFDELSIVNMKLPWLWLRIPTPELPKEGTHANPQ